MTIRSRNTLIGFGIAFAVLSAASAAYCLISVELHINHAFQNNVWLRLIEAVSKESVFLQICIITLTCFAALAAIILYFSFRTTASAEYFFLLLCLLSLSFESFRSVWHYLYVFDFPHEYTILATRTVYFGRFCGILYLFCSGLFPAGVEYQKINIFFGMSTLAAFVLVYFLTVDITEEHSLMYAVGGVQEIIVAWLVIDILSIINYLIASYRNNNIRYSMVGVGVFFIVVGRNILYLIDSPLFYMIGIALVITGVVLANNTIHRIYLWL